MDFVTCPYCGQMQVRSQDGKCIKCKEALPSSGNGAGIKPLGPFYVCPKCGHIQVGEENKCEKCNGDMRFKDDLMKSVAIISGICFFGVLLLITLLLAHRVIQGVEIYGVSLNVLEYLTDDFDGITILCFFALFVFIFFFFSLKKLKQPAEKIQKYVNKSFRFCAVDGIPGIRFDSEGYMSFQEKDNAIMFSLEPNIYRFIRYDQIIGISGGYYNYQERKPLVGGVSIGNVYIHESPVRQISKPFFQIRYIPSDGPKTDHIIRVIFNSQAEMRDLDFLCSWVGLKIDPAYVVESSKNL